MPWSLSRYWTTSGAPAPSAVSQNQKPKSKESRYGNQNATKGMSHHGLPHLPLRGSRTHSVECLEDHRHWSPHRHSDVGLCMSRAERWATMGLDSWDEYTPGEVRRINSRRPKGDPFRPSVIPGVLLEKAGALPSLPLPPRTPPRGGGV